MILTFSKDKFVDRIKSGVKFHTIRSDIKMRWKSGMTIQFWKGNPRNVKNNPYQFGTGIVEKVRWITIHSLLNEVRIDGQLLSPLELKMLAKADGFDSWEEMKEFFNIPFIGRQIYWSDFKQFPND
jgi:hypothetical protein